MAKTGSVLGIVLISLFALLAIVMVFTPLRMFAVYPSALLLIVSAWFYLKNKDKKLYLVSALAGLVLSAVALFYKPAAATEVAKDEKFEQVIEENTQNVDNDLDAALEEVVVEEE